VRVRPLAAAAPRRADPPEVARRAASQFRPIHAVYTRDHYVKEATLPVSKPMKIMTLRISEDEKERLDQLARDRNVTLSMALREGAKLYLADAKSSAEGVRVAT